ncbi:MAG: hypothetical protein ACOVNS_06375 [Erythrobacter sp.]
MAHPLRTFAPGLLLALLPATTNLGAQEWLDSDMMSNSEQIYTALDEEDIALREARGTLDACATGCLTPVEAVSTAYLAGPKRQTNGRFLLDVKGGGADPVTEPERHFYLNSHPDYRRFGTLVLAFEPEVMRKLLNPPRTRPREADEGDIIVEALRPRVALTRENMMKRFGGQRILVDGEVGLKWIAFIGTRGREGVPGEGYYQVWVRITAPEQVTMLQGANNG